MAMYVYVYVHMYVQVAVAVAVAVFLVSINLQILSRKNTLNMLMPMPHAAYSQIPQITREIRQASTPTMRGHFGCISKATGDYTTGVW
jgi:hypothetical protein